MFVLLCYFFIISQTILCVQINKHVEKSQESTEKYILERKEN